MRIIGKGHSASKKLCSVLNVNVLSKTAFRNIEKKLEGATNDVASKAKSASWLDRERLPEGPHPTRQTILNVVKRLRETGWVTSRPRVRRPRNVERKVQPEDVLECALAHPQSTTKMVSESCGLPKSRVWTILNESGVHPYRSTPVQGLLPRDAERRYTWCNFVMNNLEDHPTFLEDIIWTDEACFSRNGMGNKQNVHTSSLGNPRYAVEV
ncbi:hypothetical protein AVEN_273199-1 [Araneus ventricosus]|uniref:Transposase Tc1-like domain-containing protein n=1 Tax=Araneus ventricosus TaxID=182803 RepID=A0A4Y2GUA9_ARAVE|nr:hypothetical protein AVEN_273199-1 [Araneus ventricosus]